MSEEKKNEMPEDILAEQESAEETAAEETTAEEAAAEETYTVTRDEMKKLESLAKMVTDANDKYLRLAAEYDNYRKRTAKEKENIYGDAKADTIKQFLEVYDNLVRGASQLEDGDTHKQGLEMIAKQFLSVLEKMGVTEMQTVGEPFDANRHNAVMHVEDETVGENTVVEVFQNGFMMGEKVIRFAMVKVAN